VPPLQPERLLLSFTVHIRNVAAQSGYAVSGDDFRLLADGVPLAPMMSPSEVVVFQSSLAGDVLFLMPGTTTNAILQLGNLDRDTARVPVDLSLAR
jgi:dihydroxyacid dehydratase/phosphogluconate dehydratase